MMPAVSPSANSDNVIQDLSLLYELVSNVGQSLSLKENCKRFLKVLMARKSLKYVSVWINQPYSSNNTEDDALSIELVYGSPTFWIDETRISKEHRMWTCIPDSQPFLIVDSATQPELFQSLIVEKRIQNGVFVLLRLADLGILKLYGSAATQALSDREIVKLLKVIQKFTFSLQACLAYEHTLKENQQGQQSLLLADRKLKEQMKVLEKNQKELAMAKRQVDDKNERLVKALIKLKRTQAQLVQTEKMSSLGQLVAGIAHEINNPVSFIQGNIDHLRSYVTELIDLLDLYQQAASSAEIQAKAEEIDIDYLLSDLPKVLGSMETGSQRIKQIVLSLRAFSRLDESAKKQVDLHLGIDSALMILQHRLKAQANRPEIHLIRTYGKIPKIDCYPGPLNQVFMNLFVNAIDALEEIDWQRLPESAQPTLTITTALVDARWVEITIHDNGPGISIEAQKRLFEPFFTTKPVGKGTGLGLAICYQILTGTHAGNIRCNSEKGRGTKFVIRLPLEMKI